MFNAAALPGGYIVVFKPAITETNPDALAGILAHEVAHVHRRHVAEALIREFGIGAMVRMMGGNIGANAEQIVSLELHPSERGAGRRRCNPDAEARRDFAPAHRGDVRRALPRASDQQLASRAVFLQSHPLSKGRAERFAASFDPRVPIPACPFAGAVEHSHSHLPGRGQIRRLILRCKG